MNWKLWWKWVLATTFGGVLGFSVSLWISIYGLSELYASSSDIHLDNRDPFTVFGIFGLGVLAGISGSLFLGVAQWAVLVGRIARAYRWILATTGSITLSCAIGATLGFVTNSLLFGCLIGVCLSIATLSETQKRILGLGRGVNWFVATLVGVVSGLGTQVLVAFLTVTIISQHLGGGWNNLMTAAIDGVLAGSTVGAGVFGAITGTVLIKVLRWNN